MTVLTPKDQPLLNSVGGLPGVQVYPSAVDEFDVTPWAGCIVVLSTASGVGSNYAVQVEHVAIAGGAGVFGVIQSDLVGVSVNTTSGKIVCYVPFLATRVRFRVTPGTANWNLSVILTNRFAGMPMHTPNFRGSPLSPVVFGAAGTYPLIPYCGKTVLTGLWLDPDATITQVTINGIHPLTGVVTPVWYATHNTGQAWATSGSYEGHPILPPWECQIVIAGNPLLFGSIVADV